jgi:predicted negative regulator of RcsB-dependent stress response
MKSERRHELQHNALADWLVTTYEQFKPYQNAILGAVLLVAVALLGYRWWQRQTAAHAAEAWLAMNRAEPLALPLSRNEAEIDRVIQQFRDSTAAQWADITVGDNELASGASNLFGNKGAANEQLSRAVERYQAVPRTAPSMTRQRVTFWLARALECQGKLPEASKTYKEVLDNWPGGTFAAAAKQRLTDLEQPGTKTFYDQFASFNPKPAEKMKLPEVLPENPPAESEKKDIAKPEKTAAPEKAGEKPVEKTEKTIEKAGEKPADKTAKPAEKTEEKPVTPEKAK